MSDKNRFRLEVVVFIFSIGVAWATLTMQVKAVSVKVDKIATHVSAMQKYMSSQDKLYWQRSGDQP